MVMTDEDLDIERAILEAVKGHLSGFGSPRFANAWDVYNRALCSVAFPSSR